MKKTLLLILPILMLLCCTKNEVCKDKTFGDYTWAGGGWTNMTFGDDDTLRGSITGLDMRLKYQFDDDCNGYTLKATYQPNTFHYQIISATATTITVLDTSASNEIQFIRQ